MMKIIEYIKGSFMKYFGTELSEQHKNLSAIIRNENKCEDAKCLFLQLHSMLHSSSVSGSAQNEVDALLNDLEPQEYRTMVTAKSETIAWVLWHISRIEDLTMSILVANGEQLFNGEVKERLNATITDTGNALTDDEIIELSRQLNIGRLLEYRNAVGQKTRTIVESLSAEDMKRRVSTQGIEIIKQTGGVTNQESSLWLLDYWGGKDVAGLLLMPPTRHLIMHINDCCRWKQHMRAGHKCFRTG